jgi:hypothetical protein
MWRTTFGSPDDMSEYRRISSSAVATNVAGRAKSAESDAQRSSTGAILRSLTPSAQQIRRSDDPVESAQQPP